MSKKKKQTEEIENDRGPTWVGYYPRLTKSKREKEVQIEKKNKQKLKNRMYYDN